MKINLNHTVSSLVSAAALTGILFVIGCGAGALNRGTADYTTMEKAFAGKAGSADAVAYWHDGESHYAVTVETSANKVTAYDLSTGAVLKTISEKGSEKGRIDVPSDVIITDNLVFVLEKGNRRVQVFELPELESFGFFGETLLKDPTAIALYRIEHGAYYFYVADSETYKGQATNYIRKINVSRGVNTIHNMYHLTFGYSPAGGYLGKISAISVDHGNKRVAVSEDGGARTKAFTLEGASL